MIFTEGSTYAEYKISNNAGFKFGIGGLFLDRFLVELNYFGMGEFDIKGKSYVRHAVDDFETTAKVDIMTLTLGIRL